MIKINPNDLLTAQKIRVSLIGSQKYKITWDLVPEAEGYYVYAGYEPYYIRSKISDLLEPNINTFEFSPSIFIPFDLVIYFWVAYKKGNDIIFIDEFGSNYILSQGINLYKDDPLYSDTTHDLIEYDAQWFFEEIRRRAKAVLEDVGEEVILYKRQWSGATDSYGFEDNDAYGFNLDPNVQSKYRTDDTYGTGYYPGFFPGIKINMRFGQIPPLIFDLNGRGLKIDLEYDTCWTLWEPYIRKWDLIYRPLNGNFYVVDNVGISNIRGVNIIQRLKNITLNPTEPLCKITHEDLINKWKDIDKIQYLKLGFGIIPSGNEKLNDYLLFKFS